jgi:hypothetical protein
MAQLQERGHPDAPPGIATDGKGAYREAMVATWGQVPEYGGRGRPPTLKREQAGWQYVQVVKHREGHRLVEVSIKVIYGEPEEVLKEVGAHTAYVERTNLTSRHMTGRLVRKTLTFSKEIRYLEAACAWEDWVYNLTRPVQTLRQAVNGEQQKWEQRSPAMAARLTDHIWTVKELLTTVVLPDQR